MERNQIIRITNPANIQEVVGYLFFTQFIFIVLGSSFYTFPLYLSFLLPQFIDLSNQAITLLGGLPFVGNLGIASVIIFLLNVHFQQNKKNEFVLLTITGCLSMSLTWFCLLIIFYYHSSLSYDVLILLIVVTLLASGNASGVYFNGWLNKALVLINPKYKFVYAALGNTSFAFGSIFSLTAKLYLTTESWFIVMFIIQTVVGLLSIFVACYCIDGVLTVEVNNEQEGHQPPPFNKASTKKVLTDLICCSQQPTLMRNENNSTNAYPISSTLFYLLMFNALLLCALGMTFLATLGLLVQDENKNDDNSSSDIEDDNSNGFKHQVIILIWCSVGQTICRFSLPFCSYGIHRYYMNKTIASSNFHLTLIRKEINYEKIEMDLTKWISLWFSLVIAFVFFIFLLSLWFASGMNFLVASAVISGAYGCTWVVNSSYPFFLEDYNYSVILSLQQTIGMIALVSLLLVIAFLELNSGSIFFLLMIIAIITMTTVVGSMIEFWRLQSRTNEG